MTVSTTESQIDYTGNGAAVFAIPFLFLANSDLVLTKMDANDVVTTLVLGSDYTLSGAGNPSGGTATLTAPLTTGNRLRIARSMIAVQETDLRNQGKFYQQTIEDAFDYVTLLIQQYRTAIANAMQKSIGGFFWDALGLPIRNVGTPTKANDATTKNYVDTNIANSGAASNAYTDAKFAKTVRTPENIGSLPGAAARAGMLMGFDASGNPVPVAPAGGPVSDASQSLWSRQALSSAIANVHQALDAQAVSVWEFAGLITDKPTADPATWDWTPAIIAAQSISGVVLYSSPINVSTSLSLSGKIIFMNDGCLSAGQDAVINFDNPVIDAPLKKVFSIAPQYSLVTVSNTTTQDRQISNITGSISNEFVEPEWFGAIADIDGGAINDSYDALNIAQSLGNLHLNSVYLISRSLLVRNNRRVHGTGGRPSRCGLRIDTSRLEFTGNYALGNFERAGMTAAANANGANQNPYVSCENFSLDIRGIYRTGTSDQIDAFRCIDLYLWETTYLKQLLCTVRKTTDVETPTMYQIARIGSGPTIIDDLDFVAVESDVNVNCLADSAIEFYDMTNEDISVINININCNRSLKFVNLAESPSSVRAMNIERHPSRYGGNASTRPSIIAAGPVVFDGVKCSTEAESSLAIRILKNTVSTWIGQPTLRKISTQVKPNAPAGYFSKLIEVYDSSAGQVIESIDNSYLTGGAAQSLTSITGIEYWDGGELKVWGGNINVANHKNSTRRYTRNVGVVAVAGSFSIPIPRGLFTGSFSAIGYRVSIAARGASNLTYFSVGYLEGTGSTTSSLRNTTLAGSSVWGLTGALSGGNGSLVVTNNSGASASDVTVDVEFFGTPSSN